MSPENRVAFRTAAEAEEQGFGRLEIAELGPAMRAENGHIQAG